MPRHRLTRCTMTSILSLWPFMVLSMSSTAARQYCDGASAFEIIVIFQLTETGKVTKSKYNYIRAFIRK